MTDSVWGASAEARHRWSAVRDEQLGPATRHMFGLLGVRPGQTILDLATGTGQSALMAGELVGSSGQVFATDVAEGMVQVAQRAAEETGATNVTATVMDAEQLELPDASIDVVMSRLGLLHFGDPIKALREMFRVLRPGGVMGAIVWSVRNRNPYLAYPANALRGRMPPRKPVPEQSASQPPKLRTDDPLALQTAVEQAGFVDVQVVPSESWIRLTSAEEAARFCEDMQAPLHPILAKMSAEQIDGFRTDLIGAFREFEGEDGFAMPGELLIVTGTRP